MQPGESPLAFFLRTKATAETREAAESAHAAAVSRKDAFWQAPEGSSRVDSLLPGARVAPVAGRGRGLLAEEAIPVGTVVLKERALVAAVLRPEDAERPVLAAVRLATSVVVAGLEAATRTLEPRLGQEHEEHPARAARAAELGHGQELLQAACPSSLLDADARARLLLAVLLNARNLGLPGGQVHQGLFPEVGAMVNHGCRPNLLCQGVGIEAEAGGYDQLQLVLRTVRDVAAGEELTMSYLDNELYLPFPERDERLREQFGFGAERLPTDPGLEAIIVGNGTPENTQRVVAANSAAEAAWERLADLGPGAGNEAAMQLRAAAATHYAALLNVNLLAETHAWRFNATWRLASLLTQGGAPKSCAKALPLWESALRSGRLVWPSEHWPEHRRLLRGACRAAAAAGDEARHERYSSELAKLDATMSAG